MTVRARLLFTLLTMAVLLVVPALYGISRLTELRDITFELTGRHAAAAVALGRTQTAIADLDRHHRGFIAAADPASRIEMWESLRTAESELTRLRQAGYAVESRPLAAALEELDIATARIDALVGSGESAEATAYFRDVRLLLSDAQAAVDPVAAAIDERSTGAASRAQTISSAATGATLAVMFVSVVLAVAVGLWLTTSLTGALQKLQRAMASVAEGEFDAPAGLPYDSRDEIGGLSRSFLTMTEQLAELNRLKAEFVSVASHELKTPINVIGGYAEMIEEGVYGDLNAQQREALVAMREQVETLTRQVNQLLDLSRFESGALQVEMDEVKVRDLFTGVKRAFDALARQKGIDFSVEVDEDAPDVISGDFDRLRNEVLGNLLGNAFKFTPQGGRIAIRARGEGDRLLIDVTDTGSGISAEDIPHIFEKYYQSGQQARAMGTGLGLAIAQEIVEIHGGRIDASSEAGVGTSFHINLPIHQPSEAPLRATMRLVSDESEPASPSGEPGEPDRTAVDLTSGPDMTSGPDEAATNGRRSEPAPVQSADSSTDTATSESPVA